MFNMDYLTHSLKEAVGLFRNRSSVEQRLLGELLGSHDIPPIRNTEEQLDAYEHMPILRAITWKVSNAVAKTEWKIYSLTRKVNNKKEFYADREKSSFTRYDEVKRHAVIKAMLEEGSLEEIKTHPLLDLLYTGNSMLTSLTIRRLMQDYIDIVGDCIMIKERGPSIGGKPGIPIRLWPVAPHWVHEWPESPGEEYEIRNGPFQGRFKDEDVLWLKNAKPTHPYGRGSGFGSSISDELETDEYAAKFVKSVFYNRAKPDLLVMPDKDKGILSHEELARFEINWMARVGGVARSWLPLFLRRYVEVKSFPPDFQTVQLKDLRVMQRDIIYQTYGIPPEIMGVLTNSNRSTIAAADYHMAEYTVTPRLEFLRCEFQEKLVPEFDDRILIDYVSPVKEDMEHKLNVAKANPAALKVDEWRKMSGHAPLPNKAGQVFLVPINTLPMKKLDQSELPDDPAPSGSGPGSNQGGSNARRSLNELSEAQLYKVREAVEIMRGPDYDLESPNTEGDRHSDCGQGCEEGVH